MSVYEVQVLERVANTVDAKMMQKLTAEQLHALKPHSFKPRRDLSCSAEASTVTDAKALGKALVAGKLQLLQPPTRMLSCSVVTGDGGGPARIKVIVERMVARR